MKNFVSDFLNKMSDHGLSPANSGDIHFTEKWHDYQISGDPKGKKKGFYILTVDGNFASGRFGDRRMGGETIGWHSKSDRKLTDSEKAEWKAKRDAANRKQEEDQRRDHEESAIRAKLIWQNAKPAPDDHPYLLRKQAKGNGCRISESGQILIPLYAAGKMWNIQSIDENGDKLFIARARKKGCYYPIADAADDKSVMAICEGFATGDAVRQATGLPVIIAFDAGNLKPVAQEMRKKYPNTRFIFCADNDQWTKKPDGTPWNPGIEKATEAAASIGGAQVIWPDVAPDDEKKRTDFNDIFVTEGAENVNNRIMSVLKAAVMDEPPPRYSLEYPPVDAQGGEVGQPPQQDDFWKEQLIGSDKGLKPGSIQNMYLFIKNHPDFKGVFGYNEFQHNITVIKCPKWEAGENFTPKRIDDVMITKATAELEKFGLAADTNKVYKAIQAAAMENTFHPAREYFNSLKWDGVERLKNWLSFYLGCESDHADYLSFIGKKWLCAGVARVFKPGCAFHHVLVLEGGQGSYKSTTFRELATFGNDNPMEYFTDSITIADIHTKDSVMKSMGCLIIELSELSGLSKKDDEEIKHWITLQYEDVRLPYAREMTRYYRQSILGASTNKYDYLRDPTGSRRFWPAKVGNRIDIEGIRRDKEQLWAEAVHVYKNGIYLGPEGDEIELANSERSKRLTQDPWADMVIEKAEEMDNRFKIPQIMDMMGMTVRDKDERASKRISAILQINGYENKPVWINGKTERLWVKK